MKKIMILSAATAFAFASAIAAPTVSSFAIPKLIDEINTGLATCSTAANLTGNIAGARMTNAVDTTAFTFTEVATFTRAPKLTVTTAPSNQTLTATNGPTVISTAAPTWITVTIGSTNYVVAGWAIP